MLNYLNVKVKTESVRRLVNRKDRAQNVITMCKLLIIHYLLIDSYNSFESAPTLLCPH